MWVELICGLVIFRLLKRYFCDDSDGELLHADSFSSRSTVLFTVADRLQKLYGGKVFVGLNIPDPDSASRQNIDMVLVTQSEAVVISVQNVSGSVSVDDKDGSWVCTTSTDTQSHRKSEEQRLPDPIAQTKHQVSTLEFYLEQRGIDLPEGYLSCKVICPNPNFRTVSPNSFTPEIITYEQWSQLRPEPKKLLSYWIKGAFSIGKKDMQNLLYERLTYTLSTAPMWDRLELKGNKLLLGEFVEFKGNQDDVQALRHVRRSKVSQLIIQKTSMFGLAPSKLQVLCAPRDYQGKGASGSEWNEITVKSSTEVLFQPQDSIKVRKYKLSSVTSLSLSA